MVTTVHDPELDEVLFLPPMHPKDKISSHRANTAVTCVAAMPFPMEAMPPEDREDALPYSSSFLMQSISRNPDWLKDWTFVIVVIAVIIVVVVVVVVVARDGNLSDQY
jgi:hypothetical protein